VSTASAKHAIPSIAALFYPSGMSGLTALLLTDRAGIFSVLWTMMKVV
jgi:hypothetical protein